MEQEYLKSPAFTTFFTKSNPFLAHPTSKYSLHKMRFTSNAFIVSTVALLSLITPLVYADNEVTVTTPAAGQVVNAFDSIEIAWYVAKRDNPSAVCPFIGH